ncbi:(2Fe-2S)-binding protein [Sulfurimonas sp. C5]|uniref:(2Fe-2S)-binding protein n=1 Tax=Sulfurimonas sp. C5 TaxID=3036947 RepID=UPI002457EBD4|nr:(2Fe-2S)-binding protein [Sulfurimonas sp. C5]MDH4943730.1 (2Fe-2S)-binding protein [Sulfurimonas sp. C5]
MLDSNTEVCICNSLTAKEIAECIKKHNLKTLQEAIENSECPMGDKCEACHDEGFNNDGINIPLVIALVKQGKL